VRARALFALAALALGTACAGRVEPELDLTPWTWTFSQAVLSGFVLRYARPEGAPGESPARDVAAEGPVSNALPSAAYAGVVPDAVPGWRATRFASFQYDCAREDRAEDVPCRVVLDFWLLALDPPLASATAGAWRERFARDAAGFGWRPQDPVRDARGNEWLARSLEAPSGAAFAHYSRPLAANVTLAVTSATTRAPDRLVARDLARDAIERIRVEAAR